MPKLILAIDQGTTSSRCILFDANLDVRGLGQLELTQHYPASGHVEHDADEIWSTTVRSAKLALDAADAKAADIAAIGITNQRETAVIWDRRSGRPIHRALVWQDRRTAPQCQQLRSDGVEHEVTAKTGLLLDPYFSATKIAWLIDTIDGARAAAEAGHLAFGTIDTFLTWRLTGGRVHATDATNASRTMLFDIHEGRWHDDLLRLFRVPAAVLPEVRSSNASYGHTDRSILGAEIPIRGVIGDQQGATVGQACFAPGMMKATYGTGCFAVLNTGRTAVPSHNRLLTTIAYEIDGQRTYALEGGIFVAGAAMQWLRDGLGLIATAAESEALAMASDPGQDVVLVPAFVGLGAPYWEAEARGALFGLTRATGRAELARAALEAVACQTRDLMEAMRSDWPAAVDTILRVDGGMVANDWLLQAIADTLAAPVDRPHILETTALGAAWLAGHGAGLLPDMAGFASMWKLDRRFAPKLAEEERQRRYRRWQRAVSGTIGYARET